MAEYLPVKGVLSRGNTGDLAIKNGMIFMPVHLPIAQAFRRTMPNGDGSIGSCS